MMLTGGAIGAAVELSAPGALDRMRELLLAFGVGCAYYAGSEALFGQTLAKLITRTRVVSEDGGAPTAGQILGRTLSRYVPFDAFSFLGSGPCLGWHDRWSRTRVIRTRPRSEA